MFVETKAKGCTVRAYRGDAKTLLAFDLSPSRRTDFAGFTVGFTQGRSRAVHYIWNSLTYADLSIHAQDRKYPAKSSINAPLHKFRWVHVPGAQLRSGRPSYGTYHYVVTPRYLKDGRLQPIDHDLDVTVDIEVAPFRKGALTAAFTRGFTQSQAFVHHFGAKARFQPDDGTLLFPTSDVSGTAPNGKPYTFVEEYDWLGATARDTVLELLNEVRDDPDLAIDVFAYDLDEPDVVQALLDIAAQGRIRLILDNSDDHHIDTHGEPTPEDQVETLFLQRAKAPAAIKRGKFARFAHHKVIVVHRSQSKGRRTPVKVLTGSTNFSVTGLYVNSNHVLVFDDAQVAGAYAQAFEDAWRTNLSAARFRKTPEANAPASFVGDQLPATTLNFSPHDETYAQKLLKDLATRIRSEARRKNGSVLFAVMGIQSGTGDVYPTLRNIHSNTNVFSYGISDAPGGIELYTSKHKTGVLASGKPQSPLLPPPFDQIPVSDKHQVHHKFVVCGFNGRNPVVYCGSSNLALGGEQDNGDNLITIADADVATVFAIEAVALVDHFSFLDREATPKPSKPDGPAARPIADTPTPSARSRRKREEWHLSSTPKWSEPYFDPNDLRYVDRVLFAGAAS